MSGPKISDVQLAAMRRKQIEEQRSRNESLLKASIAQIRLAIEDTRHATAALGQYQAEALRWIDSLEKRYVSLARKSATQGYPQNPDVARAFNDWLKGKLEELMDALKGELANKSADWQQDAVAAQELAGLESLSQSLEAVGTEQAIEVGARMVARLLAASAPAKRTPAQEMLAPEQPHEDASTLLQRAGEYLSDIQALIKDEAVCAADKLTLMGITRFINEALGSLEKVPSQTLVLRETVEAAQCELIPIRREASEKRRLHDLCEDEAARIASLTGADCPIPRLGQLSSIEDVHALHEELHRRGTQAGEEAYIAQAIDQVMERHGYRVKRSVRLAAYSVRLHDLYLDERTDEGIRCYRGTEGAIMFETGAFDDSVRSCGRGDVVDRHRPASEQESLRLVDRQEAFCKLFPQIMDELDELGVVLSNCSKLPASQLTSVVFATAEAHAAEIDGQSETHHTDETERDNEARRARTAKKRSGLYEREAQ